MLEIDNNQIPPGERIGKIEHRAPQRGIIYNSDGSIRSFQVTNPYDWGIPHLKQFVKPGDYQISVESVRKGFIETTAGRVVEFTTKFPEHGIVYINPKLYTSLSLREEGAEFLEIPQIGLYAQLPDGQVRPIFDQDSVLFCDLPEAA